MGVSMGGYLRNPRSFYSPFWIALEASRFSVELFPVPAARPHASVRFFAFTAPVAPLIMRGRQIRSMMLGNHTVQREGGYYALLKPWETSRPCLVRVIGKLIIFSVFIDAHENPSYK